MAMGLWLTKKIHSADDFFSAGRTMPWWAVGLSILATYVSALSLLGGPAWSYTEGLGVALIHINYPLVVLIVVTVFLPYFYASKIPSIYAYVGERFGDAARTLMAAIFLITQWLTTGAVLYATALVGSFITGVPVELTIVVISLAALAYSLLGGIAAVIWTDVLQSIILFVGAGVAAYTLVNSLDMPFSDMLNTLKSADKLNTFSFSFDIERVDTVWSGVIAMTLYHVTVYGASQMMVQRALTTPSLNDAKKAFMLMGYGAFFIYLFFLSMGLGLFIFYNGASFENGNTILLEFIASQAPSWVMGIIAATVLAASMSSVDSALNSLATITYLDFYERMRKQKAPIPANKSLLITRWFTVCWGVLIILPALAFSTGRGSVLEMLSQVGSYFVGAKLAIFMLGFFSRNTTQNGLLVGVAAGFAAVLLTALFSDVAWPWFAVIGGVTTMLVARLVSIFTAHQAYNPALCLRTSSVPISINVASIGLLAALGVNLLIMYLLTTI